MKMGSFKRGDFSLVWMGGLSSCLYLSSSCALEFSDDVLLSQRMERIFSEPLLELRQHAEPPDCSVLTRLNHNMRRTFLPGLFLPYQEAWFRVCGQIGFMRNLERFRCVQPDDLIIILKRMAVLEQFFANTMVRNWENYAGLISMKKTVEPYLSLVLSRSEMTPSSFLQSIGVRINIGNNGDIPEQTQPQGVEDGQQVNGFLKESACDGRYIPCRCEPHSNKA